MLSANIARSPMLRALTKQRPMLRGWKYPGAVDIKARCLAYYSAQQLDSMSLDEWGKAFQKETIDVAKMDVKTVSYEESADRMRALLKTCILKHDDIVKRPERFFLAHRLLAYHSPQLGPGFWIRFTVHYNLCMGSIVGLGNKEQIQLLDKWQAEGKLGCFSLTEKFAGVNSGMIVNTKAEWDGARNNFFLKTLDFGSRKNWISQGLVADRTTVVADLHIDGKSYGPHAFILSLREKGKICSGVTHGDMGRKTIGNDLDNAWIQFDNVELPKEALLSRYADIVDGKYIQKVKGLPVFHMIGQRLFTGRVAVAQAALEFRRRIFQMTKEYTDNKLCWSPSGDVPLTSIPQLKALYKEAEERAAKLDKFVEKCEMELTEVLKQDSQPSVALVEAIAVAKVKAVEESISLTHRLKNEVGSYALMGNSGFEQADFLQCCKFAEGDSRILMQKMARDRMKAFAKSDRIKAAQPESSWDEESIRCYNLAKKIEKEAKSTGDKNAAWDNHWQDVYELAETTMRRIMKDYGNVVL